MRIAAIDVGSNSVHMIVCRIGPDLSFEVIDREKDMIRLGAGGFEGGTLPDTSIATALQTLSKFKRLAESHAVDEIIAAATSAVREAENGPAFVRAVQRDVGIRVRVISGTEEARLIHLAAAYAVGLGRRRAVVIDIGGGSTEITLGTAARAELTHSFKLGVIRLTERFAKSDPLAPDDERRLARYVRRQVAGYARQIRQRGFDRVIGCSGTLLSLGTLAAGARVTDDVRNMRVGAKSVRRLRKRLAPMALDERLAVPGLDPRRADLSAVGAVLADTLLSTLGAGELTLCDFALREGLVLDYIKRNAAHIRTAERYPDVRRRSVIELAERCRYWPEHAAQVARMALVLFDATAARHELGAREREWLEYAALLHDVGSHIGYEDHHKHSQYLIRHGGLRGFEPEEVLAIGLIARYHRKATPKKSHDGFGDLPRERRAVVRVLAAMLRLAEALDRSHTQTVRRVSVHDEGDVLRATLTARDDADLELWAAGRHASTLGDLFDATLRFELAAARPSRRKGSSTHAEHADVSPRVSRQTVRRRGHRRVRQDDPARPARQVAGGKRPPRVRD
ncbi:MAG TPA: Ppx/GppA phosphatase family protein [Vicinamibacterales bacterium]|nr:Ppx/GppA phosphatase family protein [Vicinamibacterales bacterium]